jgi:hypothetical protein
VSITLTLDLDPESLERLNSELLMASEAGDLSKVKSAFNHGADVNCRSEDQVFYNISLPLGVKFALGMNFSPRDELCN